MKELAAQRAKQLQKEEEERSREQKAKARAKLEELNRRTLVENQTQKLESNAVQQQEEDTGGSSSKTHTGIGGEALGLSGWNSDAAIQAGENVPKIKELVESSLNKPLDDSSNNAPKGPAVSTDQSVSLLSDATTTEIAAEKAISQLPDSGGVKQKQMAYKRKQGTLHERNLPEKMATSGITTVRDNVDGDAHVCSAESGVHSNTNVNDDSPQQHKKKSNRVTKNKHKTEESLSVAALPSLAPAEGSYAKAFTESKKTVTTETVSSASSVKVETSISVVKSGDSQDEGFVSAELGWLQPAEEAHGRTTGHWKAQPHRRVSKNTQSIRPVEKFHGNEGAVWTPVHPMNKSEPVEEYNHNANINIGHSSGKNGHGMQVTKGKRAEIERYIPKAVAKELSQQENSQMTSSPLAQAVPDVEVVKSDHGSQSTKNTGQDLSVAGKAGLAIDAKNADVKQNKNGKMHASWRQRSPVESSVVLQGSQEWPTSSSDPIKIMHKPADQQRIPKAEIPSQKEENFFDGWNMDPVPQGAVTVPITVKDHGGAGRGKRQQSRAQRSSGQSHSVADMKDVEEPVDKTDNQPITFGSIEMDARSSVRNENQAKADHAPSHWQPKPQSHSAQNRQGRRSDGGQRQFHEKESSHIAPKAGKDAITQVQAHQPDTHNANVEINDPHHQEAKQEMKGIYPAKEQTNIPNRVLPPSTEVVLENVDASHEQLVSSGMRRQGHHSGRFNRGQDAPYGGSRGSSVQDANKQQLPTSSDRRKHGSHYEYQPVGSYNRPDSSFRQEEAHERSQAMGSRYRERGQNHQRRGGNFYGRNSGGSAVRATAAYGNED